jgi:UDP-glucose 4-epimerase
MQGRRPTVYGDGLQTRDYVYVGDVVSANLAAADSDVGGAYNIGTGVQATVLQLVDGLAPFAENSFEPEHAPERKGEIRHIYLDFTRAREALGWEPKVALDEGLERTLSSLR